MTNARLLSVVIVGLVLAPGACGRGVLSRISAGGGGAGGETGGADGAAAGGETGAAGGTGGFPDAPQCINVKNLSSCRGDEPDCFNTCGLGIGRRYCTCADGTWHCQPCAFDQTVHPYDPACFYTGDAPACPPDDSDPSGMRLPQAQDSCDLPACRPCGSRTEVAYRDAVSSPKIGYCLCISSNGISGQVYACAPAAEWPPYYPAEFGFPNAPQCPAAIVKNKSFCQGEPDCFNSCGPLDSGRRYCTCTDGMWSCPSCGYDRATHPYNPACFYAAGAPACPPDDSDPSGMRLPRSGASCNLPACRPCGSPANPAYRNAADLPIVGYCVCSAGDGTGTGTYSCAPTQDWPPNPADAGVSDDPGSGGAGGSGGSGGSTGDAGG